jgi:hypothetical protein
LLSRNVWFDGRLPLTEVVLRYGSGFGSAGMLLFAVQERATDALKDGLRALPAAPAPFKQCLSMAVCAGSRTLDIASPTSLFAD